MAAILLAISLGLTLLTYPILVFGWIMGTTTFSFSSVIMLVVNAALCVVLFLKRRDVVLLGALAVRALVQLLSWNLNGFLCFLAWSILLVLALCVVKQNAIKLDLSKTAPLCKKLCFVPAALIAFCALIAFVQGLVGHTPVILAVIRLITSVLPVAVAFSLAQWLVDPYEKKKTVPTVQ